MGGGGGGGGSRSGDEIRALVEKAKEKLKAASAPGKRNVFISFAMEDEQEVQLLRASAQNPKSPIEFNDWSVSEPYDSVKAEYIRRRISERIAQSSVTVVYLSNSTAGSKWVTWEVEESIRLGKHVVGVYPSGSKPKALPQVLTKNSIKCVEWSQLTATIDRLA